MTKVLDSIHSIPTEEADCLGSFTNAKTILAFCVMCLYDDAVFVALRYGLTRGYGRHFPLSVGQTTIIHNRKKVSLC